MVASWLQVIFDFYCNFLCLESEMGVKDQSVLETRTDILIYTSEPLEKQTEITGPITLKLFSSTTAVGK